MHFKKLDFKNLPLLDVNRLKGSSLFDYGRIRYFGIADPDYLKEEFINKVFRYPPKDSFFVEVVGELRPHTDRGVTSCVNYYLDSGNYITNFWTPTANARKIKARRYDSRTDTYTEADQGYYKEDLILMDTLDAKNHELYALNIGQIHSVEPIDASIQTRVVVQFQWYLPIKDLIEVLGF